MVQPAGGPVPPPPAPPVNDPAMLLNGHPMVRAAMCPCALALVVRVAVAGDGLGAFGEHRLLEAILREPDLTCKNLLRGAIAIAANEAPENVQGIMTATRRLLTLLAPPVLAPGGLNHHVAMNAGVAPPCALGVAPPAPPGNPPPADDVPEEKKGAEDEGGEADEPAAKKTKVGGPTDFDSDDDGTESLTAPTALVPPDKDGFVPFNQLKDPRRKFDMVRACGLCSVCFCSVAPSPDST